MPELFEDLGQRRAEEDRHRENRARPAQAFQRVHTSGQGSIEIAKYIDFGLTFIEEPFVSYGSSIDLQALEDLLGYDSDANTMPPVPVVSGMVTEWDLDERGFWVGCWVAVRVHFPPEDSVPATAAVEVDHHFTFAATAYKAVPVDLRY